MSELDEFDDLPTLVRRLLAERGPLSEEDLALEFGEDPETFGDEVSASADDTLSWLADGRWADSLSLVGGRVVTHRVTGTEAEHDILHVQPDLELVHALPDAHRRLPSGELLDLLLPGLPEPGLREVPDEAVAPGGSFLLPVGTLTALGVGAGDLVALALSADGVELRRVEVTELGDRAPVVQTLVELLEAQGLSSSEPALLAVCANAPAAFTEPVPPVTDLIASAGIASEGDYLAAPGFDLAEHLDETARRGLSERYQLSTDEAHAAMVLIQHAHGRRRRTPDDLGAAVPFLAEPVVADAVRDTLLFGPDGAVDLLAFIDTVEPLAGRRVRPALQWLRARAYEWRGDVPAAEEALLAAERLDPDWPPTLLDLARYASDRGEAVRGLALLRRADPYEDPDLEAVLEQFLPVAGPVVGRNDPCWCGSGRKFKQCHLHRPAEHPLEERARWLWHKARRYLEDAAWPYAVEAVLEERTAYGGNDDADDTADPLVADTVLFEGGALAEFLRVRGTLLPADERLLGEQWLRTGRSVFEVTAVRRAEAATLRDLPTGDVHEVRDRVDGATLRRGALVCARVLPAGEELQVIAGAEPVRPEDRDDLLALLDSEPEAGELVAFLSRRLARIP